MVTKMTGGEIIAACLKKEGVERVFGMAGHGNQGIVDALEDAGIRHYHVYHEMVGGAAAGGYFKATHKPGVACFTCGPGVCTAIPTLIQVALDSSAVVVIAGNAPIRYWGMGASEEIDYAAAGDQATLFRPFMKRVYEVTETTLLPHIMGNAFNEAISGRPGPVLVSVPFDLQSELVAVEIPNMPKRRPSGKPAGDPLEIERAAKLLSKAKQPLIIVGGGVAISGAYSEVASVAEILDAPVLTTAAGQAGFTGLHPLYAGQAGKAGPEFCNKLTREADVILAIGTRFEEYETSVWKEGITYRIPPTKLIHIDINPREIGKNYEVEVGIVSDAKLALKDIIEAFGGSKDYNSANSEMAINLDKWKTEHLRRFQEQSMSNEVPINPHRLIEDVKMVVREKKAALIVEACTQRVLAMHHYMNLPAGDYFCEQGFQLVGFGVAEALGFKVGRQHQKIVCLTGDVAFLLGMQVISTAVTHNIPLTWVVLNNYGARCVSSLQHQYFGKAVASEFVFENIGNLYSPKYGDIANAMGAYGQTVTDPTQLRSAIAQAVDSDRPSVVDVRTALETSFSSLFSSKSSWEEFWPYWER